MSILLASSAWVWASLSGQPLPDQLDILRAADTTPQIQLLLDSSGSMGSGAAPTVCDHYPSTQSTLLGSYLSGSTWYLSRTDQLKAALTGCRSATDGIFDTWSDRVLFSIREFGGSRTGLLAPFDPSLGNLSALESAALNLRASGGTPMAPAYREGAAYFDAFFNDSNTEQCRQNYLVVMSDGVGNSGNPVPFDFVAGQSPVTVHDANYCFGNVTSGCPPEPYLDAAAEYLLVDTAGQTADVLSQVTGTQPIRTYTIGFQAPTAADALLQAMAANGDGRAYTATSYEQLSRAFEEIIAGIIARSRVAFSAGSVQADGVFSGNHLYASVFRPVEDGHWLGTTKKLCVLPTAGQSGCLFEDSPSGEGYVVNQRPTDLWTGSDAPEANAGGTGQVMLQDTFGVSSVTAPVPSTPLARRTLLTWRPGQRGYVEVDPASLGPADTWTGETCAHHALVNSMHGFSEEVTDCGAGDMSPATFDSWPIGDTVHGGTVLLQYTRTCEQTGDLCFVATVANDGMLHFYDAVTGAETAAVVPAELWRPNAIAKHHLAERDNQPAIDTTRRYYFDGELEMHHVDVDGDFLIDADEDAYLVAGLGRGGRAYYLFDVRRFDGVPSDADNPPRALFGDEATGFRHLMETWASPWVGEMEMAGGGTRSVAVFPSGHVSELDAPDAAFAQLPAAPARATTDSEASPHTVGCADVGIPPDLCATPDPASFCADLGLSGCTAGSCRPCSLADPVDCQNAGYAPAYCYDWPGLAALSSSPSVWTQYPVDVAAGPFRLTSGARSAIAYRVRFSSFDLQPGDYLAFFDAEQNEVGRLQGSLTSSTSAVASPWIYDESFTMRIVTDGVNDTVALGYAIAGVDVIRGSAPAAPGAVHRPTVYVADLARWNSGTAQSAPYATNGPGLFAAPPGAGSTVQAEALHYRFTSDCSDGATGTTEVCIDATSSVETSDLADMVCPISAEPSVFTEGGLLRGVYFGDECGQLWSLRYRRDGTWSARRLLRVNADGVGGATIAGAASKDYRKIFTRVDLVQSTCTGRRATGVYFGTGNVQRPAAQDALQDSTVTAFSGSVRPSPRDVVGVVWDSPDLPAGASLDELANVTEEWQLDDPTAPGEANGWFIELDEQERMLRDPLVFDGVAYFDVFRPTSSPTECISASGESRVLAMDNCNAEPLAVPSGVGSPNEARTAGRRSDSTIGGGFLVLTPLGKEPIVTLGQDARGDAALPRHEDRSSTRIFMWRL